MKNLLESKTYIRLYTYSKKHLPFRLLERVGLSGVDKVSLLSTLTTFGLPLIIGALIYYPSDIFKLYPDKTPFYLIYIVLVAFSVWLGGLTTGIITTGLISIESFFLFRPPLNDAEVTGIFTTQLALFAGSGIILSFLINFARRTQEIEKLKQREKTYAQNLAKLHVEYLKAREEIRARDEFLSIASHELKTPLTTMLLKLHKMLNDIRNVSLANFSVSELMKVLENGEQQINALKARINDLLNVSLITTGRMSLERKKTDLVAVTRRVKESFSEMLKRDGYILNIETKSAVIGHWDETRIEQVIANLLSNAIKYGRKKPINIKIFNSRGQAKFVITDQGVGIPRKDRKVLFKRFKRLDSTGENNQGLGVGLYIAKQIVTAHVGKIKVSSIPMRGTTFAIELPLNKAKVNSS